jgi:hypothetical protein
MRLESAVEQDGSAHEVTSQNVAAFAHAWAKKELIVNTEGQIKAVLKGLGDVTDGLKQLATFNAPGGTVPVFRPWILPC